MAAALPRLACRRQRFGPLSADRSAEWWRDAEVVELRENLVGSAPAQGTRVRTAWDGSTWAVLFEMEDAHPWATLTERDGPLWTEETVEVFVDPCGDLESYFEVEINPLGTVVDLVLRRSPSGWRKDFGWQVEGLDSLVRRTEDGWAAEFRIPFDALTPTVPPPGTVWRANFLRIDRPSGPGSEAALSAWSPTGGRNFHRPEFFGNVKFIG